MIGHVTDHQATRNHHAGGALTGTEDWTERYANTHLAELSALARQPTLIDDYLVGRSGRMFELGCGGSRFLARGAHLGWDVGGIDFNITGIDLIRGHLAESGADPSNVVCDDVFTFDCTRFARTYDILASFGFLEHFRNPAAILSRWKCVLNESGIIVSAIPNLFSINARLLEKYDIDLWRQHVPYSPEEMDEYHSEAGLVPIRRARYFGLYDLHMLVPWGKIEKQIARPLAFRMLKLTASYVVAPPLRLISKSESRLLSPLVVGVYAAGHS